MAAKGLQNLCVPKPAKPFLNKFFILIIMEHLYVYVRIIIYTFISLFSYRIANLPTAFSRKTFKSTETSNAKCQNN